MKIAMVICQDILEIIWNAFRLANMMLEGMEDVTIFLNGPSPKNFIQPFSSTNKRYLERNFLKDAYTGPYQCGQHIVK